MRYAVDVTPEQRDLIKRAAEAMRMSVPAWSSAVIMNRVDEVRARLKRLKRLNPRRTAQSWMRFTEAERKNLDDVTRAVGIPLSHWIRIELLREAHDVLYGLEPIQVGRPRVSGRSEQVCALVTVHEDDLIFEAAEMEGLSPSAWAYDILVHEIESSGLRAANPKGGKMIPWTDEEKALLHRMFEEGRSDRYMADRMGKDVGAIQRARFRLGLTRRAKWTPRMVQDLTRLFQAGSSDAEIAEVLGTTRQSVKQQRQKLGLRREGLSPAIKQLAREYFELGFSATETAEQMGLTRHQVSDMWGSMGLRKSVRWTPELEQKVRDLYHAGASDAEIGKAIGISTKAAGAKRFRLGLPSEREGRTRRGVTWTPELKQLVQDMHAAGASDEEIAKATGSTVKGVQTLRSEMGVVREIFWTPERDEQLRAMFEAGISEGEMARQMGVSLMGLRSRRQHLGLLYRPHLFWTPEREEQVVALFHWGKSDEEMAEHFGVTPAAIRAVRGDLDLVREPKRFWTGARDRQLRELFEGGLSDQEMADRLGVSLVALRARRQKLRIRRERKVVWTRERDQALKTMYEQGYSDHQIADALGVKPYAVTNRRVFLRLGRHLMVEAPRKDAVCANVTPKTKEIVKLLSSRLAKSVSAWFRDVLLEAASLAVETDLEALPRRSNARTLRRRLLR